MLGGNTYLIFICLLGVGVLCMLVGGVVLCVRGKKSRKKSQKRLGIMFIAISLVAILGTVAFFTCMKIALSPVCEEDIVVKSPDGGYELIIREWQAIGGSGAYVYIKDGFFKEKVDHLIFDDYSMPFKDGCYEVEWQDEHVVIRYSSGVPAETYDDPATWRVCEISLK